jgi:uncharacterized protein (TIGR02246 family)
MRSTLTRYSGGFALVALIAVGGLGVTAAARGAGDPVVASGSAAEVEGVLGRQQAAWNRGDLVAFTAVYAEDATFVSPSGLTHGREEVLQRYRRRYPDRRAMGALDLRVLEVRPLGGDAVSVVAHWRIAYPDQPERKAAEGSTLLVMKRSPGGWLIVQDASM